MTGKKKTKKKKPFLSRPVYLFPLSTSAFAVARLAEHNSAALLLI
jgi:hypothetical protein